MNRALLYLLISILFSCGRIDSSNETTEQFYEYELDFLKHENIDLENELALSHCFYEYTSAEKSLEHASIKHELRIINNHLDSNDYTVDSLLSDLSDSLFSDYIPHSFNPVNLPLKTAIESMPDRLIKEVTFQRYKRIILREYLGRNLGCASLMKPKVTAITNGNEVLFLFGILDSNVSQKLRIDSIRIDGIKTSLDFKHASNGYINSIEIVEEGEFEFFGKYLIEEPDGTTFEIPFVEEIIK